jgi:pimeloyl-ACP methyl ester carboxylesterase
MQKLRVNDIEIAFVDRGVGPPLVLLHGFPLDHAMWRSQIEELAGDYRVIAPDLRGFGGTALSDDATAEDTITMAQLADDTAGLLTALEVSEPVALCGLSMGGYVAWQFWRKHAERLARLILCDTRASADGAESAANRLKMVENVRRHGTRIVAEAMLPTLFAPETHQRNPAAIDYARQTIQQTDPRTIMAIQRGMAQRADMTSQLAAIDLPALVIVGESDAITPPDEMRALAESLPRAELVVAPDAGHMSPLESPAAVNAALRGFLMDYPTRSKPIPLMESRRPIGF